MTNTNTSGEGNDGTVVRKKTQRVKTVEGVDRPRDEGTPNPVSEVRGTDSPDQDPIRRVGLSGVQPSDPIGNNETLRDGPAKVASGRVKPNQELEQKIVLLNAYRRLLTKKLPVGSFGLETARVIQKEYIKWVEGQVHKILGDYQGEDSAFTKEEVAVLKALAGRVFQKQSEGAGQKPVAPQTPLKTPTNNPPAQPLTESVNLAEFRKAQMDFLRQLDIMDKSSPQF